mmetsp:Transcript_102118/g.304819  ORF Transcript_102118/g.304819 Transcript_102118/m.304819 type:complete len:285 (-) Transcript_102118:142-996(-)
MSCCVNGGSASRIRSPRRLKKKTALAKMGLDSEKSTSAGKKVDQTFQNSGGDLVSVSRRSDARLASVSKTLMEVSSISRIFCSSGGANVRSPRLRSLEALYGIPSRHCSMKETTTSFRVSMSFASSSDSCMMLKTMGRMMSAAGFTMIGGCCMPASAPAEVCVWVTALRSAVLPVAAAGFSFSPFVSLPRSWVVLPDMAFTRTSSIRTESCISSLLEDSNSAPCMALLIRRSCLMSSGASAAFCTRRSSWKAPRVSMARMVRSTLSWMRSISWSFRRFAAVSRM